MWWNVSSMSERGGDLRVGVEEAVSPISDGSS